MGQQLEPVYQHEWGHVTPADFDEAMAGGGVDLAFVFGMRATKQGEHDPFYREATRQGLVELWHMGATPSPAGNLTLSNPLSSTTWPPGTPIWCRSSPTWVTRGSGRAS